MGQLWLRILSAAFLVSGLVLAGTSCGRKAKTTQQEPAEELGTASSESSPTPSKTNSAEAPKSSTPAVPQRRVPVSTSPPPAELWREFRGHRALENAKKLVALGSRPAGSSELEQARRLIVSDLEASAWEVERVPFDSASNNVSLHGVNLVARFSAEGLRPVPRTPRAILLVAPYDTRAFSTIRFVGANDGASGPAMLLEMARVLALNPRMAERVAILFADASEPLHQFSPTDGSVGSRHFLAQIDPKSLRRVLVLGGVAATGETLTVPPDTAADIWQEASQGCARLGQPSLLRKLDRFVLGDHVAFAERGISTLYLGNHEYLARYTADDGIERLSATTMEQVGQFATWLVAHWAQY